MEPEELRIEEADIRALIDKLVQTGVPQTLDTLSQWYVQIVTNRITAQ